MTAALPTDTDALFRGKALPLEEAFAQAVERGRDPPDLVAARGARDDDRGVAAGEPVDRFGELRQRRRDAAAHVEHYDQKDAQRRERKAGREHAPGRFRARGPEGDPGKRSGDEEVKKSDAPILVAMELAFMALLVVRKGIRIRAKLGAGD